MISSQNTERRAVFAEMLLNALEQAGSEQAELSELVQSPELAQKVARFVYQSSTGVLPLLAAGKVRVVESGECRMYLTPR